MISRHPPAVRAAAPPRARPVLNHDAIAVAPAEAEPEAYRLLDLDAVRAAGAAALHLKLEPRFSATTVFVDLPDLDTMPARWGRYLDDQDLTGYDRSRITGLGEQYLSNAVEAGE